MTESPDQEAPYLRRSFVLRIAALALPLSLPACMWEPRDRASAPALAPRDVRLADGSVLTMLPVGAGRFTMGSPETEPDRGADEQQHEVLLTTPYWLGATEVTQRQWRAVMKRSIADQLELAESDRRVRGTGQAQQLWGEGPEHPIYYISWDEAVEFCDRVDRAERVAGAVPPGFRYALPSEAQWEFACRAGSNGPFGAGAPLDEMAWYANTASGTTERVASKRANAWGFHDMHGNVLGLVRRLLRPLFATASGGSDWSGRRSRSCRARRSLGESGEMVSLCATQWRAREPQALEPWHAARPAVGSRLSYGARQH